MKKKILSLVMGIFMCVFAIFPMTSCSLVKTDTDSYNDDTIVLKIGDTEMTRSDVISAFYTYYQNNSSYFSYYDDDVIESSFYQWLIVRQLLSEYSSDALYSDDNLDGYIYYTKEDAEDVWNSVLEYFYSAISDEETIIYAANSDYGDDEETYPVWLRDSEDEEEDATYEYYF